MSEAVMPADPERALAEFELAVADAEAIIVARAHGLWHPEVPTLGVAARLYRAAAEGWLLTLARAGLRVSANKGDAVSYSYAAQRDKLFTDDGQKHFLAVRDLAFELLALSGAVMSGKLMVAGDAWLSLAAMDRMIELGELREVTVRGAVVGQDRVFVRG